MTTDDLEHALSFAAATEHSGDPRVCFNQAKAACRTLAKEIQRLQQGEAFVRNLLLDTFILAIRATADAAIVSDREITAEYAFSVIGQAIERLIRERDTARIDSDRDCHARDGWKAEADRLQVIVDRLPKYRDGALYTEYNPAPGVSGWALWRYAGDEVIRVSKCHTPDDPDEQATGFYWIIDDCDDECDVIGVYSTREAASTAERTSTTMRGRCAISVSGGLGLVRRGRTRKFCSGGIEGDHDTR